MTEASEEIWDYWLVQRADLEARIKEARETYPDQWRAFAARRANGEYERMRRAAEEGRRARMDESVRYPSYCIRHRQLVKWIPAPGWWIHAIGGRTCPAMLGAKAPPGNL